LFDSQLTLFWTSTKELQSQLQAAISDKELLTKRLVAAASSQQASATSSNEQSVATPTPDSDATTSEATPPSNEESVKVLQPLTTSWLYNP